MTICAIVNCRKSSNLVNRVNACVSFFRFPNDPRLKRKWINATGRTDWYPSKNSRICSIHFSEDSFIGTQRKRLLTKTAYPTIDILLTNTEEEEEEPPMIEELPKASKKRKRGNRSNAQPDTPSEPDKSLVLKVLQYFEEEKKLGTFKIPVKQAVSRTAVATGLSVADILMIKAENFDRQEKLRAEIKLSKRTPGKKQKQLSENEQQELNSEPSIKRSLRSNNKGSGRQLTFSEADFHKLGDIVNSFYTTRNEMPTLQNVLDVARRELNFPGGSEPLRMILVKKLGCKLKLCKETNRFIILPSGMSNGDELASYSRPAPSEPPTVSHVTTIIPLVTAELGEDMAMTPCESEDSNPDSDTPLNGNENADTKGKHKATIKEEIFICVNPDSNGQDDESMDYRSEVKNELDNCNALNSNEYIMGF